MTRINRELGGDINANQFDHCPEYNEEDGVAKSFLVSKIPQKVRIQALQKTFEFDAGEKIHTEISRKYNDEILEKILQTTDLNLVEKFTDSRNYFADYLIVRE